MVVYGCLLIIVQESRRSEWLDLREGASEQVIVNFDCVLRWVELRVSFGCTDCRFHVSLCVQSRGRCGSELTGGLCWGEWKVKAPSSSG